jgi:hypothetical protein
MTTITGVAAEIVGKTFFDASEREDFTVLSVTGTSVLCDMYGDRYELDIKHFLPGEKYGSK